MDTPTAAAFGVLALAVVFGSLIVSENLVRLRREITALGGELRRRRKGLTRLQARPTDDEVQDR